VPVSRLHQSVRVELYTPLSPLASRSLSELSEQGVGEAQNAADVAAWPTAEVYPGASTWSGLTELGC
jgi:hypothetical protein